MEKLVQAMFAKWQPDKYRDDNRDALLDWIIKKARTGEGTTQAEEPEPVNQGKQKDVMDLLQRSLERMSGNR